MPRKRRPRKNVRSSVTGQFVETEKAKTDPAHTVTETMPLPRKKRGKKK